MATQLRPFLSEIANAIRSKKGTSGVINAQNFASEIASIPSGGGNTLKTLLDATKSAQYLFRNSNLTTEEIENLISYNDTENVENMNGLFYQCSKITTMPLINTSNATDVGSMFSNCGSLISAKLNTDKVSASSSMFIYCRKVKTIDITKMSPSSNGSFAQYCQSLTKLIIRNMEEIPIISSSSFGSCNHFTGTVSSTYNPDGLKDGRIYVPDDKVEELKAATGWADFADIIVPLSTLVE